MERPSILFGIRDTVPYIFAQLPSKPGIDSNSIKRSIIASNAYLENGAGRSEESIMLRSRAGQDARRGTTIVVKLCE